MFYFNRLQFEWDKFKVGAFIVEDPGMDVRRLLGEHGYPYRTVGNRGVDGYFIRDEFWDAETLLGKRRKEHPLGSWGC